MMTLRRVLRRPADAIEAERERERRWLKASKKERERENKKRPLKSESVVVVVVVVDSVFFSLLFALCSLSKKQFDRCCCSFINPLSTLSSFSRSLSLSLSRCQKTVRTRECSDHSLHRAQLGMSAAAAMPRPLSRDGEGIDAATTTMTPIARPGSAAKDDDDNRNSSGRKEGSGRATQKRAFDLVLR